MFHILLIGSSFDQILQRLGNFLFTNQIIDCFYTLYKYRFYSNVILSTGEVFNQLDRALHHNLKRKRAKKMPSVATKRVLRKKLKRHFLCYNQKLASLKPSVQLFWKECLKFKTQNMNMICLKKLTSFLMVMDL